MSCRRLRACHTAGVARQIEDDIRIRSGSGEIGRLHKPLRGDADAKLVNSVRIFPHEKIVIA